MPNLGMAISGFTSGFAQGAAQAPDIQARRDAAKLQQRQAEAQFTEYQQQAPLRQQQAELQMNALELENNKLRSTQMREYTYQAFDKYNTDSDARHLNNLISTAKQLDPQSIFAQASRVDKLDGVAYDEAIQLLRGAGIENPEDVFADAKDAFVITTDGKGNRGLVSMVKVQAATGYTRHADSRNLEQLKTQAQIENLLTGPKSAESSLIRDIAKQEQVSLSEATKIYRQASQRTSASSTLERVAKTIQENNPAMSDEEALAEASTLMKSGGTEDEREARILAQEQNISYQDALNQVNTRKERSTDRVKLDETKDVRAQLDELGAGSFFEADLADTATRRKAGPLVTELEKLSGKSLTNEDKRLARNVRELTMLGAKAGSTLTDEETGLIDRLLRQVKSYTSNEVTDGTAGTAAYETYRNIFRNSLYGASLTDSEIKAFNAATGTLGQQTGPVLTKLNESMRSMKEQLQGIYDLNDEYVAQYYLGRSLDELDGAIESIDERIALVTKGMPSVSSPESRLKPLDLKTEERAVLRKDMDAQLDAIFGGG